MGVKFFLVENQRLTKAQTHLHGQVADHLVAGRPTQFILLGTPQLSPIFQAHIVGVKQRPQLVDVHVHVEPQPVDGQRLLVAIEDAAPCCREAYGSHRLVFLPNPVILAGGHLQPPEVHRQQQHAAQDERRHHPDRNVLAA